MKTTTEETAAAISSHDAFREYIDNPYIISIILSFIPTRQTSLGYVFKTIALESDPRRMADMGYYPYVYLHDKDIRRSFLSSLKVLSRIPTVRRTPAPDGYLHEDDVANDMKYMWWWRATLIADLREAKAAYAETSLVRRDIPSDLHDIMRWMLGAYLTHERIFARVYVPHGEESNRIHISVPLSVVIYLAYYAAIDGHYWDHVYATVSHVDDAMCDRVPDYILATSLKHLWRYAKEVAPIVARRPWKRMKKSLIIAEDSPFHFSAVLSVAFPKKIDKYIVNAGSKHLLSLDEELFMYCIGYFPLSLTEYKAVKDRCYYWEVAVSAYDHGTEWSKAVCEHFKGHRPARNASRWGGRPEWDY